MSYCPNPLFQSRASQILGYEDNKNFPAISFSCWFVGWVGVFVLMIYLLQRDLVVIFVTPQSKPLLGSDHQNVDRGIEVL